MAMEINFNRRVLDALRPTTTRSRIEYRDVKEGGLYLFLSSGGRKTFFLYKFFQGRPVRIKLGCYPDLSVSAAREQARKLKAQMALGHNPFVSKSVATQDRITLRALADEYLELKNGKLKPASLNLYSSINRTCLASLMDKPIVSISKQQLLATHESLTSERGKYAADSALRAFGMYFNFFADRYDYPGINPVKTISQNRLWNAGSGNRRQTYIKDEDLPLWFEAVINHPKATVRDYVLTCLFTGMRRNEARKMCWDHIDFDDRLITVHETKNSRPHTLPMSDFLFQILSTRAAQRCGSYVFPAMSNPEKPFSPSTTTTRLSKASGVKFSLHDLRRTFSTIADSVGLSHYTIKALLNHKSGADVTQGYIMREVENLRDPMQQIANRILKLAKQ